MRKGGLSPFFAFRKSLSARPSVQHPGLAALGDQALEVRDDE
jgi:hypothetical protein